VKFIVKYEEMPAQTTVGGKIKLDKAGNPLQSIRIKQSIEQRRTMLKRMKALHNMYLDVPGYWPKGKHQVANDPRKYTVEEMFDDFTNRLTAWRSLSKNDLYKSFVERHNFLLDCFIVYIGENELVEQYGIAELADYTCRITLKEHNETALRLRASLMASDLFDIE